MRVLLLLILMASTAQSQGLVSGGRGSFVARGFSPATVATADPGPAPAASNLPASQQASPADVIAMAIRELHLTSTDVLADIGCGDARVLIQAARECNCRGVGIEIDPGMANRARRAVEAAGLQGQIEIITGNAKWISLDRVTAVYAYLWPDQLAELAAGLKGKRVASAFHEVPGLPSGRQAGDIWVYGEATAETDLPVVTMFTADWCGKCVEAKQEIAAGKFPGVRVEYVDGNGQSSLPTWKYTDSTGAQRTHVGFTSGFTFDEIRKNIGDKNAAAKQPAVKAKSQAVAIWQGAQYTAPVCNSPSCTMCRSIRQQLRGAR